MIQRCNCKVYHVRIELYRVSCQLWTSATFLERYALPAQGRDFLKRRGKERERKMHGHLGQMYENALGRLAADSTIAANCRQRRKRRIEHTFAYT